MRDIWLLSGEEPVAEAKLVPADPKTPAKPAEPAANPAADPAGKLDHKNRAIENWMKGHMEQVFNKKLLIWAYLRHILG